MNWDQSYFCSSCYWIRCVSLAYRAVHPHCLCCARFQSTKESFHGQGIKTKFLFIRHDLFLFTFQERQKAIDLFLSDNYSNSILLSFFSRKTLDFHSYLFQPTSTLSPVRAFTTKSPVPTQQCPTFVFTRAVKADQGAFACQILLMKNLWIAYRKKDRLLIWIGWIFLIKEQDMFFL